MEQSFDELGNLARQLVNGKDPEALRKSSLRIRLEIDTPLERLWGYGIFYSALALAIFGPMVFNDPAKFKFLLILLLPVFFGSLLCYFNTDNFYVIDFSRQALMYRFKMFFYETYTLAAPFSQIAFVTVDGIQRSTKSRVWWEYALMICLKDGRLFPVSDHTEDGWEPAEDLGLKLARFFQAEFIQGRQKCYARARRDGQGKITIIHQPRTFLDGLLEWAGIIFVTLVFLIIAGLFIGPSSR